jgi:hypothetical protein
MCRRKEPIMTSQTPAGVPLAAAAAQNAVDRERDDEQQRDAGPTVGASDAAADAARSGADVDLDDTARDSDGVPVGNADADEDARQSGAGSD